MHDLVVGATSHITVHGALRARGMLSAAVVPKTDGSSTHVLSLCGGLGSSLLLCVLSSFGFSLSSLFRGLSQLRLLCLSILRLPSLQSPWLLQRPGIVELFAALVVVSLLLLLKRFLDSLHLVLQLNSFLFFCGFPRHLLYRSNLAPM